MRVDGLLGWIGAGVFGTLLLGGAMLVLQERNPREPSAEGATRNAPRLKAEELPDLDRLEEDRDTAQAAYRAAEARGERGAATAALERFNAAARRYSDAKLRRFERP